MSNYEEIINRLNELECQFRSLLQSLKDGSHPWGMLGAARVTGAMAIDKIARINISESELLEIYANVPQLLATIAVRVSLTADSYRQPINGEIYLENSASGNYWAITTYEDIYWLVPKCDIKINSPVIKALNSLFKCLGYEDSKQECFLIKPARLSFYPSLKLWKLEEQGELNFVSPALGLHSEVKRLQQELEKATQEREKMQGQIDQLFAKLNQYEQNNSEKSSIFEQANNSINQQDKPKSEKENNLDIYLFSENNNQETVTSSKPVDWQELQLLYTSEQQNQPIGCLALINSLTTPMIASSDLGNSLIKLWDLKTGKYIKNIESDSVINALSVCASGKIIIAGGEDNKIKFWDVETGELQETFTGHDGGITSLAINANGQFLVSASRDKTIKVWDLQTRQVFRTLTGHLMGVLAVVCSADGHILVSSDANGTIKIWSLETGKTVRTFQGHSGSVGAIAISPDGNLLVSGSRDRMIKVWNLSTQELMHTIKGHGGSIFCLAISADGQILVSGSSDKTIKIWRLNTGELLNTITKHYGEIYSLVIHPSNQYIVSGSEDKTIKFWQVKELI